MIHRPSTWDTHSESTSRPVLSVDSISWQRKPARTRRILVVEDDVLQREDAVAMLRLPNCEIRAVGTASEAIAATEAEDFDIVLLDVGLPSGVEGDGWVVRDGLAVCEHLHQRGPNPPLVILITGRHASADIVRGLEAGASDYLIKPVAPEELIARVRAMLRLRARLEDLQAAATTDPLTGLWNRGHLPSQASQLLLEARRSQKPLSCLMLDLDHFKLINDRHGHLAGDTVLREVAHRIRTALRRTDLVFRYGGEEFVVFAANSDVHTAARLAKRITNAVRGTSIRLRARSGEMTDLTVTGSIGVSQWQPGLSVDALVGRADQALSTAKKQGRDRIQCAKTAE